MGVVSRRMIVGIESENVRIEKLINDPNEIERIKKRNEEIRKKRLAKRELKKINRENRRKKRKQKRFQTKKKNRPKPLVAFYESREWLELRYKVLKEHGRKCMLCGRTDGTMHVDHIKPRYYYPSLELCFNNLQVLCKDCNKGKGAWDETDWRPKKDK